MMNGTFDATNIQPSYGSGGHPPGLFDAQITNTTIKPVKDNPNAGLFEIEFSTPVGKITDRYNLWNPSAAAVEIAQKQLSAVCHATGVFKLNWNNAGAELRGAKLKIEVGFQKGQEPSPEKPNGGYVEVKKVFDAAGNEPGRAPAPPPAPTPAPTQGGWGAAQPQQPQAQPQQAPQQPQSTGGWTPPAQQAPQQQAPQQPQNAGWQPGPTNPPNPPWAR